MLGEALKSDPTPKNRSECVKALTYVENGLIKAKAYAKRHNDEELLAELAAQGHDIGIVGGILAMKKAFG